MSPRTRILTLLAALSLGACAAPYAARQDGSLGYESHYVADGIFYVEFAYNGFTGDGQAEAYFERRCGEVCSEEGFPAWEIVESSPSEEHVSGTALATGWEKGRPVTRVVPVSGSVYKITGHVRCLTAEAAAEEQAEMGGPAPLAPVRDPEEDE